MKQRGVTLFEVMIVTAIIAILAAIAIPAYQGKNKKQSHATQTYVDPGTQFAPQPAQGAPLAPLTEECVNGFAFIRGNGTVIQKMGDDNSPARC